MMNRKIFLLTILLSSLLVASESKYQKIEDDDDFLYGNFPEGFLWGLATSSYQIEGGWASDGKGPNSWDFWSQENNGSNIADGSNGNVACDSYNKYNADVDLLKNMNAHFYRFSLSWSRIIPTGRVAEGVSQAGLNYYNNLINALLAASIQPFITLYHWDLPLPLFENGGWLNDNISDHFADYSKVVFEAFGDRVKLWLTFNEPHVFCTSNWNFGLHDPFEQPPEKPYICAHNTIKSHGLAYRIYENQFKATQGGQIGITLNCDWPEPKNASDPEHLAASERSLQFRYGLWAHPLLYGDYPPIMRELLDQKSEIEGRNSSRLPTFNAGWTATITGTLDFLGLNHYSSHLITSTDGSNGWLDGDGNYRGEGDPSWNGTGIGWAIVPWGLRKVTTWVAREYNMPIYITENGFGGKESEETSDPERLQYYRSYINEVMKSVVLDGSDVRSYTAWSLIDNYEWTLGYTARFGVHYVNFTDPNLTRSPKDSAVELTKIFADNGFPAPVSLEQFPVKMPACDSLGGCDVKFLDENLFVNKDD